MMSKEQRAALKEAFKIMELRGVRLSKAMTDAYIKYKEDHRDPSKGEEQ